MTKLIDADAFKQTFCAECVRAQCENCTINYHFEHFASTVDLIKHGHWIENDNGTYSCSECHSWIPNEQHYYARYCLFCGAKMDEVTDETG